MASDEARARRRREQIGNRPGVTERAMFGGLAFLVDGTMFVGINESTRMACVGAECNQGSLLQQLQRLRLIYGPFKRVAKSDNNLLLALRAG